MYRSTYLRETRKEKYERADELHGSRELSSLGQAQGLEHLQELNERFANYINWARGLEQRNAIFRKQLETFQRLDELAGLEEAFSEQIELNLQRARDLAIDRAKLEREDKDAQRVLDEFRNKYQNECEYQLLLKETLERLNKEADEALLHNLELQIESQFLQDDISAAKDRYKKNLLEIQTYVSVLQQIIQNTPPVSTIAISINEEKLIAERRVPILQSQLEEYKGILAQLQMQKSKLQTETVTLEQTIKHTQESYDDEIQLYNEQIETLRKEIEDAERMLEKYTNDCRQLAIYQQSLENELERYKRIIENEDNRLNSAIVGTPITLFTQSYQASYNLPSNRKDITRAMQDITTVKPRQKGLPKKASRKKEIIAKDKTDETLEDQPAKKSVEGKDQVQLQDESQPKLEVRPGEAGTLKPEIAPEDVPDGARLSKAFGKVCNIIKERVRSDKVPEPQSDLYTKGRYVLVTGDASYTDPDFCSSSIPAKGGIIVSIDQSEEDDVEPVPGLPEPPCPNGKDDPQEYDDEYKNQEHSGDIKNENQNRDQRKVGEKTDDISKEKGTVKPCPVIIPGPNGHSADPFQKNKKDKATEAADKGLPEKGPHGSMTYEKVEVVESIEKFSTDRIQTYEETAVIVETMIEKTNRKKLGDKSS
ncbi:filensin [Monodelphis domestica]|uniref:filensin n=1 Tax=Monodelphis domestica TaxID=13616 RepID=UPI0024E257CB|nr:filensin [Monodelphis domestica]